MLRRDGSGTIEFREMNTLLRQTAAAPAEPAKLPSLTKAKGKWGLTAAKIALGGVLSDEKSKLEELREKALEALEPKRESINQVWHMRAPPTCARCPCTLHMRAPPTCARCPCTLHMRAPPTRARRRWLSRSLMWHLA